MVLQCYSLPMPEWRSERKNYVRSEGNGGGVVAEPEDLAGIPAENFGFPSSGAYHFFPMEDLVEAQNMIPPPLSDVESEVGIEYDENGAIFFL